MDFTTINKPIKLNFGEVKIVHNSDNPDTPRVASYSTLKDKPSIEGVTLVDDKELTEFGVKPLSRQQALDIVGKAWD